MEDLLPRPEEVVITEEEAEAELDAIFAEMDRERRAEATQGPEDSSSEAAQEAPAGTGRPMTPTSEELAELLA